MQLLLGIDGGGTKTEFTVTDTNLIVIQTFILEQSTNPWKDGIDSSLEVLKQGLTQLDNPDDIIGCVAGISGNHSSEKFIQPYTLLMKEHLKNAKFRLTGDLLTSFYAVSSADSGLIAISGSGSSICLISANDSTYTYDGVGYGGKDIGVAIIKLAQAGYFNEMANIWINQQLDDDLQSLTVGGAYSHPYIHKLVKAISHLTAEDPLQKVFEPHLSMIATRWAMKLWATSLKFRTSENISKEDEVVVVLSGSIWLFDFIREHVITELKRTGEKLVILFQPDTRPVMGAVKMAKKLT